MSNSTITMIARAPPPMYISPPPSISQVGPSLEGASPFLQAATHCMPALSTSEAAGGVVDGSVRADGLIYFEYRMGPYTDFLKAPEITGGRAWAGAIQRW